MCKEIVDRLVKEPWNKGKLVGQKPPFKLKEIWAIRIRLQIADRIRDLALFNLAIDSGRNLPPAQSSQAAKAHGHESLSAGWAPEYSRLFSRSMWSWA